MGSDRHRFEGRVKARRRLGQRALRAYLAGSADFAKPHENIFCGIFAMDKVRRLAMVVRAADLGGFAAAAKHMNITPSAVSRGIAELARAGVRASFLDDVGKRQLLDEIDAYVSARN